MRRNYAKKRKLTRLIVLFAVIAAGSYGVAMYLNNMPDSNDVVFVKINQEKIYKSEIERKIK